MAPIKEGYPGFSDLGLLSLAYFCPRNFFSRVLRGWV